MVRRRRTDPLPCRYGDVLQLVAHVAADGYSADTSSAESGGRGAFTLYSGLPRSRSQLAAKTVRFAARRPPSVLFCFSHDCGLKEQAHPLRLRAIGLRMTIHIPVTRESLWRNRVGDRWVSGSKTVKTIPINKPSSNAPIKKRRHHVLGNIIE
jgi:hypothetical protein